MRHVEVEVLGAVVVASPERDGEAYLAQRNCCSIGDTNKRPRRCQSFVGDLQLLECPHRDHVEARTSVEECLGDGDVVDGGGADEGDGARSPRVLEVIAGVEGDLIVMLHVVFAGIR